MESRGVSYQQDPFFRNKQKKLFASRSWPIEFSEKVDITKVSIESLRPWIEARITKLLGQDDEIVYEYCVAQLEAFDPVERTVDPREIQLNLEGFLGVESSAILMRELWSLLISAQSSPLGVPQELIDERKREADRKKREADELKRELDKKRELMRQEQEEAILRREKERRAKEAAYRREERRRSPSRERRGRRRSRSRDRLDEYRR